MGKNCQFRARGALSGNDDLFLLTLGYSNAYLTGRGQAVNTEAFQCECCHFDSSR